jgi:prevent-host-death family protein
MTTVGTFEAKTHLTRLLGKVAKGEKILITNRGQPVAMLVPPEPDTRANIAEVVAEMLAARNADGPKLGKYLTVRKLRDEGRPS